MAVSNASAGVATREELVSYINTGAGASPSYQLIGEGFISLTEALNPVQKDSHFIHNKNGTSIVTGYAPTSAFEAQMVKDDPACMFISEVGRQRKTGGECETDIVTVYTWLDGSGEGKQLAYKQKVALLVMNSGSGAGGEALALSGTFLYKGDPIKGDFDPTEKTFTAI